MNKAQQKDTVEWFKLGLAYGKSGQTSKAIDTFQQAIRINPEDTDALFGLGIAYKVDNKTGQIMDVYKRLKVLDSTLAEKFFNKYVPP